LFYFIIVDLCFEVDSNLAEMSTIGLRECDRLDGASNFIPWKLRLQMLMEEAKIWEHVEKEIATPIDDLKLLATHNKKEAKDKRIILDFVKDHFITHIVDKTTSKEMFEALIGLFQSSCVSSHRCSCETSFQPST
jgi:hypothetical protein